MDKRNKDKYYPIIRHGYLHLKHKLSQKYDYPDEIKELCKPEYDLDNIHSEELLTDEELFVDKESETQAHKVPTS